MKFEAPAKVNLSLLVKPPRPDGYHPLESLVQTIDWVDHLTFTESDTEDGVEVTGLEIESEDNLIAKAIKVVREAGGEFPPQKAFLEKEIPIGAGLGGGSSDAAAALLGAGALADRDVEPLAVRVGADVSLFLTGGTVMMRGIGEEITSERPLEGFSIAVVVPEFGMSTAEVYRRWDEMEGPVGEPVADNLLPPALRGGVPVRNDLSPAATDLEPRLGDLMTDLGMIWGGAVCLTGSGSGLFGFFASIDEAQDAASAAQGASVTKGVGLRDRGAVRVD